LVLAGKQSLEAGLIRAVYRKKVLPILWMFFYVSLNVDQSVNFSTQRTVDLSI